MRLCKGGLENQGFRPKGVMWVIRCRQIGLKCPGHLYNLQQGGYLTAFTPIFTVEITHVIGPWQIEFLLLYSDNSNLILSHRVVAAPNSWVTPSSDSKYDSCYALSSGRKGAGRVSDKSRRKCFINNLSEKNKKLLHGLVETSVCLVSLGEFALWGLSYVICIKQVISCVNENANCGSSPSAVTQLLKH